MADCAVQSVGVVTPQTMMLDLPDGGLMLDRGGVLPAVIISYETCGAPRSVDNVIFICHALTGDAHVAGIRPGESEPSGWWEGMIGPGSGIDTTRYHVVCANVLGGCKGTTGPSSINPATSKPYGSSFPQLTLGDTVRVYRMFLHQLGVTHLAALVGGSFGGMQVLEWLVHYSDEVDRAIIIASGASLNSQALAFDIVGRHSIIHDQHWNHGDYYDSEGPSAGLAAARKLAHITYLSQELMESKFGREKRPEWLAAGPAFSNDRRKMFGTFFQVESYLDYQARKFIERFDANSYLQITYAMDEYSVAELYGSLEKAFEHVSSRILLVSLSGDWLFTPEQSEEIVAALLHDRKEVSYCHLHANAGHDAFLTHIQDLKRLINAFLPATDTHALIRKWQMRHYEKIVGMIPEKSRILDIGCGDGVLLNILRKYKQISGTGIELDIDEVIHAVGNGNNVLYADADGGLAMIPDRRYNVAVLSETLQVIKRPKELLSNILRIADEAVVTFPNFACWNVRWKLALFGRMPKGKQLPFEWYNTPNIHLFTLKDFDDLCRAEGFEIRELICQGRTLLDRVFLALGMRNLGAARVIARIAPRGR